MIRKITLALGLMLAATMALAQTASTYYTVPSISALKVLTTRPGVVEVLDSNPGIFNWGTTPCSAADDTFQVTPTSGPTGCYTRMATPYAIGKTGNLGCIDANIAFGITSGIGDNTAAFNLLIADANSNAKCYALKQGSYRYVGSSLNAITAPGGRIIGAGNMTELVDTSTSGNAWKFGTTSGPVAAQPFVIENVRFTPLNIKSSGAEVACRGGSYRLQLINVAFSTVYRPLDIGQCNSFQADRISFLYVYGDAGVYAETSSSALQTNAININNLQANNPYPAAEPNPSLAVARVNGAAATLGQIFVVNGHIWQVSQSGTLGTGTSQYVLPTLTADLQNAITDGTAQVKWVSGEATAWVKQDSYTYSVKLTNSQLINGVYCFQMVDTLNEAANASIPGWAYLVNVVCSHPYSNGYSLQKGRSFRAIQSSLEMSVTGNGGSIETNFLGEVSFAFGEVWLNAKNGWEIASATNQAIDIARNLIGNNSHLSSGTYSGIKVNSGGANFSVAYNLFMQQPFITTPEEQKCAVEVVEATDRVWNVSNNQALNQVNGTTVALSYCFGSTQTVSVRANNTAQSGTVNVGLVDGLANLGTGVATALKINTGTIGSFVVDNGVSATVTVRNSAGTGTCNLVFTSGLFTSTTC